MHYERALCPAERATDVFDRASTLNFTIIARVRASLTESTLTRALRALEQRHPLLRASVVRNRGPLRFQLGSAEPIALRVHRGDPSDWRALAEQTLAHRVWSDTGPRAELIWLRHGEESSTLLLCLHHLVSDGSSGIFAMRDLLALASDPSQPIRPIDSPGQHRFYPPSHGGWRWQLKAARAALSTLRAAKPQRLDRPVPGARAVQLRELTLSAAHSSALLARAREGSTTVHGVVCAALARGVVLCSERTTLRQRLIHPVDLRRYLRALYPDQAKTNDAVGYYVSSLDTDHVVNLETPLATLARDITSQVREKKAQHVPLLMSPIAAPWVTWSAPRSGDLPKQRARFERQLFQNTFSVTNLGPLEQLGATRTVGALELEHLFFVAAGSVFSALGAAVTSFNGALTITLTWVEPLIARETGEALLQHVTRELTAYA